MYGKNIYINHNKARQNLMCKELSELEVENFNNSNELKKEKIKEFNKDYYESRNLNKKIFNKYLKMLYANNVIPIIII